MSVAVLINRRARKGSQKLAQLASRMLPRARIALTSSLDECRAWLKELRKDPPALLLSGGGDGTTTTLLNELAREQMSIPPIGVLPMGTGNAWAHVTGAPSPKEALQQIAALGERKPPMRSFGLVRVNGSQLAPFAGTGFDADLVNDYKAQLQLYPPGPLRDAHSGLRGYLGAVFTRTIPRHVFGGGPAHVRVINLGKPADTLDETGNVVKMPGGETGAVLFEGLAGVAGAATIPEWGYRFRAFPNAERVPGRLSVRVYSARALEATRHMFKLWGGKDVPNMHDYFVDHVRMEFDRKVPLQFGGDVEGEHETLEFELAKERVDVIDWRALQRTN